MQFVKAQPTPITPGQLKPAWQKLLLELSTNYFTVVKENQVDLDSSLIHVSSIYKLSRLPIALEGIDDNESLTNATWFNNRNVVVGERQLFGLKGRQRAQQLIILGAFYAFEPLANQNANRLGLTYLKQAIRLSSQLNQQNLVLIAQRLMGKILLKQADLAAADDIFKQVLKGYSEKNDKAAEARTLQWWALYTPVTPTSTPGRLININNAVKLFSETGNREEQVNALINNSYLLLLSYNLDGALKTAKQAVAISNNLKFPYYHYVIAALNTITMFQGKFGEPLGYCLEAVQNCERLRDSIGLPYFYTNTGTLYSLEGDREETALKWNLKAINCFLHQKEPCYVVMCNSATDLLLAKRPKDAYAVIQRVYNEVPPKLATDSLFYYLSLGTYYTEADITNLPLAEVNLIKADQIEKELEKHGMAVRKAAVLFAFGTLYRKQNKLNEARRCFQQFTEQTAMGGGFIYSRVKAWGNLIKIDSLLGDKDKQLNDLWHYNDLLNEDYRVSKTKLAEELQVKYATEKKESQIRELTQRGELEKANLEQANLVKNITAAGVILLVIIAGLLYRQMTVKQKSHDIIAQKNDLLQRLLEEKEWLVKEIHHRVKNNLHTVICLLESQAAYLDNDALKAIETSQHRIYAMSLIHQKLYQSDDIKVIDINAYITEFIQYLADGLGAPKNIKLTLNIDAIKLGPAQAIPVGLIINEAVTNAIKHAFPGNRKGEVHISLKALENYIILSVSDDGIGFNIENNGETKSLGLELIKGLSKDLRGSISFETNNGTAIILKFLKNPMATPVDISSDLHFNTTA